MYIKRKGQPEVQDYGKEIHEIADYLVTTFLESMPLLLEDDCGFVTDYTSRHDIEYCLRDRSEDEIYITANDMIDIANECESIDKRIRAGFNGYDIWLKAAKMKVIWVDIYKDTAMREVFGRREFNVTGDNMISICVPDDWFHYIYFPTKADDYYSYGDFLNEFICDDVEDLLAYAIRDNVVINVKDNGKESKRWLNAIREASFIDHWWQSKGHPGETAHTFTEYAEGQLMFAAKANLDTLDWDEWQAIQTGIHMEISFELARRISNWLWINGIDSPLDLTGEIKE